MASRFTRLGTWLVGLVIFALAAQVAFGAGLHKASTSLSNNSATSQQPDAHVEEANKALEWMKTQQQPDGSFAGFGAGSTVDAVLAIVAAGKDPTTYSQGGNTPITFLQGKVAELSKTPGGAGKLLLAASALARAGQTFDGTKDLISAINAAYDPNTGHYGKDAIGHAFAILGLLSVGSVPTKAVEFLASTQTPEGGWAFSGDTKAGSADTNTTAVVVQALMAAGVPPDRPHLLDKASAYLTSQQNSDGGFPYQKGGEFGSESDVNSTAYVIQALRVIGDDTSKPISFLLSMQKANGAFQWKPSDPSDNPGATYQAIPALLGNTLVSPRPGEDVQGGLGVAATPRPGMPSTGNQAIPAELAPIAILAVLALGAGMALRRTLATR